MSVLIKGIEMPTSCRACMFSRTDIRNTDWCVLTEKDLPCDCPLVPVPPHGRLIEAEAAKEFLKPIDSLFCYEPEWTWGELYESNCAAIDKLPTIIPAEEGE